MTRTADHEIEPLFLQRWSGRAMSGAPLEREALARLFEAARWAPSSGNNQPWRLAYAIQGSEDFERLFSLLAEGNRPWCRRAGALMVVLSKTTFDNGRPARTHSFDAGAAWMSLALQATAMGLVVHGMEGFDYERAANVLGIPDDWQAECMVAVGYPGSIEDLPERYRARETPSASGRHPIADFAFEGPLQPR